MNRCPSGFLMLLTLSLWFTGCGPSAPTSSPTPSAPAIPSSEIVATVDGLPITVDEFNRAMAGKPPQKEGSVKDAVLEELVSFKALLRKAKDAGYDRDPDLVARMERMVVAKYQQQTLKEATVPKPTEEQIQAFYEKNIDSFTSPERFRIALIYLKSSPETHPEKAAELKVKMEAIRGQAVAAAGDTIHFGDLARQHSEDQASRYRGGDVGWLSKGTPDMRWDQSLIEAMLALKNQGDISPVVTHDRGLYLFKLMDHQPAYTKPLEQIRAGLEYRVAREIQETNRKAQQERIREGIKVELNQEVFDSIIYDPSKAKDPPKLPGF